MDRGRGGTRLLLEAPLSITVDDEDGVVVVAVAGELDLATAPALQGALVDVIVHKRNLSVRVDLAEVTFIDSTGLNVLVGALKQLRERDGQLTISNPASTIMRLFDLTGLSSVFTITQAGPR